MDKTPREVIELSSSSYSTASSDPDYSLPRSYRAMMNNTDNNASTPRTRTRTRTRTRRRTRTNSHLVGTSINGNTEVRRRNLRPRTRNVYYEESGEASNSQQTIRSRPPIPRRKRTERVRDKMERTILSWLIDRGVVNKNETLNVEIDNRVLKIGRAKRKGVLCMCCKKIMTVSEFAAHAGSFRFDKPYEDVCVLDTKESLLQCQIAAWKPNEEDTERFVFNHFIPKDGAIDKSDDCCLICADGGDLLCCERCPSTYHPSCVGMEGISQVEWLCPYCVCKLCGRGDGVLLSCVHCEKKYHWLCLVGETSCDLNSQALETLFCGLNCKEVYCRLQSLIGVKNYLGGGLCWTLLQRSKPSDWEYDNEHVRVECNSKISIAWEVLNECFRTNIDRYTEVNVVQSVVYGRGSDLMRINFRGFYTAVLEKNDSIISVATIRIHGNELAEMPFIATRQSHRHAGMSKMLLRALQSMLCSVNVQHLLIPSLTELVHMWERNYGFSPISDALKQIVSKYNTVMFLGTVRLQKRNLHR